MSRHGSVLVRALCRIVLSFFLSLSLFSFLSLSLAIPQSGLLSQVSSLGLLLGHSGQVFPLSNASRASLSSPHLQVAEEGLWAASPLGIAFRHTICGV